MDIRGDGQIIYSKVGMKNYFELGSDFIGIIYIFTIVI
jgi:hypothetical protein